MITYDSQLDLQKFYTIVSLLLNRCPSFESLGDSYASFHHGLDPKKTSTNQLSPLNLYTFANVRSVLYQDLFHPFQSNFAIFKPFIFWNGGR